MSNRVDTREIEELFQFIAEKTENVTAPLFIQKLSNEFHGIIGGNIRVDCLAFRIKSHARNIHKMNQFDTETKVKMMFALSAPVDYGFLEELRKDAEVTLDENHRIIEYKDNDGGLTLSGNHAHRKPALTGNDKKMLNFLAEKSENEVVPILDSDFLAEFKETTETTDSLNVLRKRYQRIKKEIYTAIDLTKQQKVRMLFVSGALLPDYALREFRNDALIVLDSRQRIIKYTANDGSLELEGIIPHWSIKRKVKKEEVVDDGYREEEKEDEPPKTPKRRRGSPIRITNYFKFEPKTEILDVPEETEEKGMTMTLTDFLRRQAGNPTVTSGGIQPLVSFLNGFEAAKNSENGAVRPKKPNENELIPVSIHIRFLGSIRSFINILNLPALDELNDRIEERIHKFEMSDNKEEKVTCTEIRQSIMTSLHIISKRASMKVSEMEKETTSLKNFLEQFQKFVLEVELPFLKDCERKLEVMIEEFEGLDKKFPIKKVFAALQTILDFVAP